jgi:hypothetical protein
MMSIYELPFLAGRHEYFVNELMLNHDPIAYQCLEERYNTRVEAGESLFLDFNYNCKFMKARSSFADCEKHPAVIKPSWS